LSIAVEVFLLSLPESFVAATLSLLSPTPLLHALSCIIPNIFSIIKPSIEPVIIAAKIAITISFKDQLILLLSDYIFLYPLANVGTGASVFSMVAACSLFVLEPAAKLSFFRFDFARFPFMRTTIGFLFSIFSSLALLVVIVLL